MDPFDPRDTPNRERDQQIALAAADLSQDWTLAELGAVYGITAQRVQQILVEYAPRLSEGRRARRRAERQAEEKLRRRRRGQERAERRRHGTRRRYVLGCRCERCRAANAAAWRQGYARRRART